MSALAHEFPHAQFEIFTRVPIWFFEQSFEPSIRFRYHELQTDVGFVQATSMSEDYSATIEALDRLYPLSHELISDVSALLCERKVQLVVCDISVLGIEAARPVGIPSVLVENFTWDWIYSGYIDIEARFARFIDYLAPVYQRATLRIQAEPVCKYVVDATVVSPIARRRRARIEDVRESLRIDPEAAVILCSMGGIPGNFSFLPQLASQLDLVFVLAGCAESPGIPENVRAVPHRSGLYHPDLVAAADAVVGKVGYSTVAEAYYGRTQFLFLPRPLFAESAVMERFVTAELCGHPIDSSSYQDGSWLNWVSRLLMLPRQQLPKDTDGAAEVVALLAPILR